MWAWSGLLLVVALGSVLDVMEVDAAQYAGMARDMLSLDHRPADATWLKLYFRGEDYLDKPPLLFWLSALSFKLFGVSNWSYKLPSILFGFLGVHSTYRFARLYHDPPVARTAAFLFGGSAAFMLMTNDVRTDTILTGSVIAAIWLGAAWMEQRRAIQLVGFAIAVACGMLAKGPMGIMAPALALGGHALLERRWRTLVDVRWLMALIIIALLLTPMCIGLLEQHGPNGLRFYFWEQSFGRLTGENRWKDDSTVFFFTHELLWQLLPWTAFVLAGLWRSCIAVLRGRTLPEYASVFGAVTVFLALSLSRFKLPHYLYVVLPLFAVMAARAWHDRQPSAWFRLHAALLVVLWMAALLLTTWSFPQGGAPFAALLLLMPVLAYFQWKRSKGRDTLFALSFQLFLAIAVVLNGHFYPNLLRYQANAQAGRWAAAQGHSVHTFYGMQVSGTALDFYAGFPVRWLSNAQEAREVIAPGVAIYTDEQRLSELLEAGLVPRERIDLSNYPVQLLGSDMLDPAQRPAALSRHYLLQY